MARGILPPDARSGWQASQYWFHPVLLGVAVNDRIRGAIVALSGVSWRRKARGLFISIPTIFVLNAFRNAGIVWLHVTYPDWRWLGLDIFDFAHSYAAKGGQPRGYVRHGAGPVRPPAGAARPCDEDHRVAIEAGFIWILVARRSCRTGACHAPMRTPSSPSMPPSPGQNRQRNR